MMVGPKLSPVDNLLAFVGKIANAARVDDAALDQLSDLADAVVSTDSTTEQLLVLAAFAYLELPIDSRRRQVISLVHDVVLSERRSAPDAAQRRRRYEREHRRHRWQDRADTGD